MNNKELWMVWSNERPYLPPEIHDGDYDLRDDFFYFETKKEAIDFIKDKLAPFYDKIGVNRDLIKLFKQERIKWKSDLDNHYDDFWEWVMNTRQLATENNWRLFDVDGNETTMEKLWNENRQEFYKEKNTKK